jgi:hypothetical protein
VTATCLRTDLTKGGECGVVGFSTLKATARQRGSDEELMVEYEGGKRKKQLWERTNVHWA